MIVDFLFSGEGPDLTFVEAEVGGKSVNVGKWIKRGEYSVMQINVHDSDVFCTGCKNACVPGLEDVHGRPCCKDCHVADVIAP